MSKKAIDPPMCDLCRFEHWTYQPHVYAKRVDTVADVEAFANNVTKTNNVTPVTKIGRGRPKRYETDADKQRAYRERHA